MKFDAGGTPSFLQAAKYICSWEILLIFSGHESSKSVSHSSSLGSSELKSASLPINCPDSGASPILTEVTEEQEYNLNNKIRSKLVIAIKFLYTTPWITNLPMHKKIKNVNYCCFWIVNTQLFFFNSWINLNQMRLINWSARLFAIRVIHIEDILLSTKRFKQL